MGIKRKILSFILVLILVLAIPLCAFAASEYSIIWNMINYYGHHQAAAKTDILYLLEQLRSIDPEKADNWQLVMEGWDLAYRELELTPDVAANGLPTDNSLCFVVMGYQLNNDGTMKEELIGRLQAALASGEKYPNAYILCTGGATAGWMTTEAGKMATWLTEQGIDPTRIIVEDRSISSEQNALFSLEILEESHPQVDSLVLISSDYHLRRCHVLFHAALALNDLEDRYTILGNTSYDAERTGNESPLLDAECLGLMAGMDIQYTSAPTLARLTEITLTGDTEYATGDDLNLTVTAHYDIGFTRDVTCDADFIGYDPEKEGIQEVTVTYTENGKTATAVAAVTVIAPSVEATLPPATAASAPTAASEIPESVPATAPAVPQKQQPPIIILLLPLLLAAVLTLILIHILRKERRRKRKRRKE